MQSKTICIDERLKEVVSKYLPSEEVLGELSIFFSVFSDNTRLKMLSALSISEMCVTDLSIALGLNQTTVSHQLKTLKGIGAVKSRRQGKIIFYSLKNEGVNEVLLKGVEFLGF